MLKNTANSYGVVAKGFHWLLFLMLTFSIVAGNFLASMPKGAEKLQAAGMHKSFGAVILMLVMLRLVWRLINKTPRLPDETTAGEAFVAKAMHWGLYATDVCPTAVWNHDEPGCWFPSELLWSVRIPCFPG